MLTLIFCRQTNYTPISCVVGGTWVLRRRDIPWTIYH